MIKLVAVPQPDELTDEVINELTNSYKKTKKSVWKKTYIKEALLKMSNNKCCYCECEINVAGSDLHIEHFYPKDLYEDEVIKWDNLLPACARCNRKKGALDTKKVPIIHPVKDNPRNHLTVKNFYFYSKNDEDRLGEATIEILDLNDGEKLALDRYKLGHAVMRQLKELTGEIAEMLEAESALTNKQKLKFNRRIKSIMQLGTAEKKYSALISTVILTDINYTKIKQLFEDNGLWDEEVNELEQQVIHCSLI